MEENSAPYFTQARTILDAAEAALQATTLESEDAAPCKQVRSLGSATRSWLPSWSSRCGAEWSRRSTCATVRFPSVTATIALTLAPASNPRSRWRHRDRPDPGPQVRRRAVGFAQEESRRPGAIDVLAPGSIQLCQRAG
jgi:hypothetical protein